jgi:chitodextrinase
MGTSGLHRRAASGLIVAAVLVLTVVVEAAVASAAPKDRSAPTTPTDLRVTGTTASSVSLTWNPSTDKGGVTRLRYIVVDSRGFGTLVWHPQTTVRITSLTPGATYSFHVYAEDGAWNRSGNSNTVTATLPRDTTPPTPPVLSVTGVTPSEVWLSWTASTDDIPLNLAGYRVLVDGAPATNVLWLSERQAAVRHLTRDTTYSFMIEARDRSGNVATSNTVAQLTPASTDTEAPTAPGNLRWISEHGDCEVVLGWDQSTDNVDAQPSIRYEFYLNGVLNDLAIGVDSMLTYGFRGAELSTFTLVAVDRSGNASAPSSPLTLAISGC